MGAEQLKVVSKLAKKAHLSSVSSFRNNSSAVPSLDPSQNPLEARHCWLTSVILAT
jgi:hypothetical protein